MKQLIPPKGIKRNFEDFEQLEYMDSLGDDNDENKSDEEIYQNGDDDDENESNDDESESAVNDEEIAQSSKNTSRSAKIKSLVNISSDLIINKDARFLEQIQALLLENDTSDVFKPHLKKMVAAFFDARKSAKKRIAEKTGQDIVMENMEDQENIFVLLKDK